MILGILVALSPYLGLPLSTLAVILPVLGLAIAAIGLSLKMRERERGSAVVQQVPLSYDVQEA